MGKRGRPRGNWDSAFVVALVETRGVIRTSADLAGVDRCNVYRRLRADESFRKAVLAAIRHPRINERRRAILSAAVELAAATRR